MPPKTASDGVAETSVPPALKRSLGLTLLVLYGLGVTIGAGIYVLVGTAAARAGSNAPVAFVIAAGIMAFTAASFAELAVRFPVSAGEAAYVEAGLGSERLGRLVGLLVAGVGIVSAAAIAQGAVGYIGTLVAAHPALLKLVVVVGLGLVAAWGIEEAIGLTAVMTLIEIAGLAAIVLLGVWQKPAIVTELPHAFDGLSTAAAWPGLLGASLVAFFAFIGFEGMVNVAEEVKSPETTLPRAIAITLVITTLLYVMVVWVVGRSVPADEIGSAAAPLSLAYERLTGASPLAISLIAIVAIANGVIAQLVMASRVIYGMARQGTLPKALGAIDRRTRTPLAATGVAVVITLVLALAVPIDRLADTTTRLMLVIFVLVNAALAAIKRRGHGHPGFTVPVGVPVVGCISCAALLVADLLR